MSTDLIFKRIYERYGSQTALAVDLGISKQFVSKWRRSGVPAEWVGRLGYLLDLKPHEIRPDLFPCPEAA